MSSDKRVDNQTEEIIQRITGPTPALWIPERLRSRGQDRVKLGARWIVAASRGYATGANAAPTELLRRLRALPFPDLLYVLASIGLIATREPLGAPVYRKLASIFINKDELRSLVAAIKREEDPKPDAIQVFTRGGILLATKLALALGDNSAESSNDLTLLGSYLLDVNDFVAGARYRSGQGSSDYKALMIEILAAWDLSNPPDLLYALGRVYTMLREITSTDDARIRSLTRALPRSLESLEFDGVKLDDYIAILFGIYGRLSSLDLDDVAVGRVNAVIDPQTYLGETKFPRDTFSQFLDNRSKDLVAIRQALLRNKPAEPNELLETLLSDAEVADMTALRRSPLIRLADGRILCIDLPLITQLLTEGVYWTALDTLNRIDRSHGDTFLGLWGRLFELYGADLLRHFYPNDSGLLAIDLKYRTGEVDAALDFGSYVVLIEFKASLLTVAARSSRDTAAFEAQFRKKFVENERGERKGVQQLADSVNAILSGDLRFTAEHPIIYPVLVCYESCVDAFWMNRYANELFAQSVPGGLGDRVRPLTLVSMEGFEMALPYTAAGDFTWKTLFESRFSGDTVDERSVYQAIYDWRATNDAPRRVNDYLKTRFDRIFETIMERYRGDHERQT